MSFLGTEIKTPVINASGTVSLESEVLIDLSRYGALVTKSIKLSSVTGNVAPRVCETPSGMLNAIGLEGAGIDAFLEGELPLWFKFGVPVIVSIAGACIEDYVELAKLVDQTNADAMEANFSCPNVKTGMAIATDPEVTRQAVSAIKSVTSKPVIVKLTPNVTSITSVALAAKDAGADAISAINTVLGMRFNVQSGVPILGNKTGGLSGPAILPIALRCVWQIAQALQNTIPIIGMGGIFCANDAKEFFCAGANVVALGTVNMVNPSAIPEIIAGINQ